MSLKTKSFNYVFNPILIKKRKEINVASEINSIVKIIII